jgi:hypothetical protein
MSVAIQEASPAYSSYSRPSGSGSGLADVVDLILEKGLVVDVYARISLVGIEIMTIDVRVVVASVDTYLRFARACNRLDIAHTAETLPQLVRGMEEERALSRAGAVISTTEHRIGQIAEQKFHDLFSRHATPAAVPSGQETR